MIPCFLHFSMSTCEKPTKCLSRSGSLEANVLWKEVLRHVLPENNFMVAHLEEHQGIMLMCSFMTWILVLPQVCQSELMAVNNGSFYPLGRALYHLQIHTQNLCPDPLVMWKGHVAYNGYAVEACSTYIKGLAFTKESPDQISHWLAQDVTFGWEHKRCFQGQSSGPCCLEQWH